MKKALCIIVAGIFIFTACEDLLRSYSSEQRNVINTLEGSFHAYMNNEKIIAVMSFLPRTSYITPSSMTDRDGVEFLAHGECFFSDCNYPIPDEGYIPCYYSLSEDANTITLYNKGGVDNKRRLRDYKLHVSSDTVFTLNDNGRLLKFEKVK